MKQSAAKTLGAAALGAAFVAAAAGSASAAAAPAAPDAAATLGAVTQALPVDQVASKLPAGGHEALMAGQDALGKGAMAAVPNGEGKDPVSGLLGGLPTKGLPTGGLPGGLPAVPGVGA
ncbi:ATP-binding protein [Streptomyces sp. NBC_00237]|uniref:ATP-binding protein n=1 Tax=Streptomyces sp. NBC_00237 TaxID=2975687 RepID=UPI002259672B|nr:ATP-binding protein [Streptomyces sp. NBC_00237]MCX5204630.1 ATP-binding protein [Streptomyces sp. NBC_00237]